MFVYQREVITDSLISLINKYKRFRKIKLIINYNIVTLSCKQTLTIIYSLNIIIRVFSARVHLCINLICL